MSTTIDKEIVQMVFDAKGFQKGVSESVEAIDDLKSSFDLSQAQKSLANLDKASRISFRPLSDGVGKVTAKISTMGVITATVISNMTNSIINGAKSIADTLFLEPMRTGLEEYETQLNAIQTILANTAKDGETLETVGGALDELNEYADLTIYNFTQMTDSIGKFTTAGVDLETSVSAIKGIANAAAISGSNAQQASTAMYQLSQAISSGTVRLQDWISVENAGMGGQIMQEALMETARVHGVAVDKLIEDSGSFRSSLADNWLTSDIMLDTLEKFTGDLTEAELVSIGYTEEQIQGIIKLGETANDAATKIKTLTQLKDTMMEALQSGWGVTWRLIFGDFEEAKRLWGGIAEVFGGLIDKSSDARNSMLEMWKASGGRVALVKGFMNVFEALINIMGAFQEAIGDIFKPLDYVDLFQVTYKFLQFSEALRDGTQHLEPFKSIVRGVAAAFDILRLVIGAVLTPLVSKLGEMGPAAGSFVDMAVGIADSIVAFREFAIETNYFETIVDSILTQIDEFVRTARDLVDAFLELGIIQDITSYIGDLEKQDFVKAWSALLDIMRAIAVPFVAVALATKTLATEIAKLEIVQKIGEYFNEIGWSDIKLAFNDVKTSVQELIDGIQNSDLLEKFLAYFDTFDGRRFTQFMDDAREGFAWVSDILTTITSKMEGMNEENDELAVAFPETGEKIKEGLGDILDYLIDRANNLDYATLFDAINTGIFAGLAVSIGRIAKGDFISNALGEVFGEDSDFGGSVIDAIGSLEDTLTSVQNNIKADTLQKIAISIALLAGSIVLLTLVDSTKLLAASGAIALMVGTLFGSAGAMKLVNSADATKAALAILGLASAMLIVSVALKAIDTLDPKNIETTLQVMAAGLVGLVGSVTALSVVGDNKLLKTVAMMIGLGVALNVLILAIRKFGEMKADELQQGLMGVAATMALFTTSMLILSKTGGVSLIAVSFAMAEMAAAVGALGFAVLRFGMMDVEVLAKGLKSVGIILVGFGVFSRLLNPAGLFAASLGIAIISASLLIMAEAIRQFVDIGLEGLTLGLQSLAAGLLIMVVAANLMVGALPGALAMIVMSGAILVLSLALKVMSTIPWEGLLVGLAGIAGIFVILGLAGLLLAPIVPILLGLGAAMLLIGAGAALFGVGLMVASIGLVALAGASAAISGAIALVGGAIISILPQIGTAIAQAMINFLQVMADNTPKIIEAMRTILLGMIETITSLIPDIVGVMMDMVTALLEAVATRLPDMIQSGMDILLAFLQGIADNIAEVVATALTVIAEFISGIAQGIPDIIDSAFELILAFLTGIADAVEEYFPQILAAGARIGVALINGVSDHIASSYEAIKTALGGIIDSAIAALKAKFGIESPSKVTYELAEAIITGFVLGITDRVGQVEDVVSEFASRATEGIRDSLESINSDLENELEFKPVISPVVNLDAARSGVNRLNGQFQGAGILASIGYEQSGGGVGSAYVNGTNADDNAGVIFNQFNYSPKALDRPSIYRQTKTIVSRLALEEIGG